MAETSTPMDPSILLEDLYRQEEELRLELIEMEGKFNIKKEKYIKIQGAIEGLRMVSPDSPAPPVTPANVEP